MQFCLNNVTEKHYSVKYLDSADNPFIQIADVLANLYYSELITGSYTDTINVLKKQDILKAVFEFPPRAVRKKFDIIPEYVYTYNVNSKSWGKVPWSR